MKNNLIDEELGELMHRIATRMKAISDHVEFSQKEMLQAVDTMTEAQLQVVAATGVALAVVGIGMGEAIMHEKENPFLSPSGQKETLH